jgi:hypothetical protein
MISRNAFILAMAVMPSVALGQIIDLSCKGRTYRNPASGPTGPVDVRLDLDRRSIALPWGDFPITQLDQKTVHFGRKDGAFIATGILDRIVGTLHMTWKKPKEAEKERAGKRGVTSRFTTLWCVIRKLF